MSGYAGTFTGIVLAGAVCLAGSLNLSAIGERSERVSGKLLSNLFQPPQQDKVCPHPGRSEALSSFSNSGDVGNGMVGQFAHRRF